VAAAQLSLERLHPGYRAAVGKFIAADPLKAVRAKLDADRVAGDPRTRILRLGGSDENGYPADEYLTVQLVPDIAPFRGEYRLTTAQLPGVPNLPRINGSTPVGSLMRIMTDLRIGKLCLRGDPGTLELERSLLSAARACGVPVGE
jgi:hypothetical protein